MAEVILAKLAIQVAANTSQMQASLKAGEKSLVSFTKGIASTAKSLVAGFGLIEIGKGIINVTSEFEKFGAILTNTLGDSSKAQRALQNIRDFALTTPFEVAEVTAAYVRWANQGLSPTIDRMKKLGDIASSLGVGFEQTAEAFKDLAVGQTKRIEEIGISAQQANGKIQLSFKGINIEIEKNAEGVQKALDVYSQLNGVLGTSDAVAKTLGGKISNLSDAWNNFLLTIGNSSGGVIGGAVEGLTNLLFIVSHFDSELAAIGQALSPFHDLRDVSKETLDYLFKIGHTAAGPRLREVIKPFENQGNIEFIQKLKENELEFLNILFSQGVKIEDINVLWDFYVKKRLAAAKADTDSAKADRLKEILDSKASALVAYNKLLEENIQKEKKAQAEREKIAAKRIQRGAKVLLDFSQTDLVKLIADSAKAFQSAAKQHEEDFKIIVKVDDKKLTQLPKKIEDVGKSLKDSVSRAAKELHEIAKSAGDSLIDISGLVANGIANLADALGTALGSGDFKNFGKNILDAVASFAQQLGALMISSGIAEIVLESGNPAAMIVAGAALVAAGAAIKATLGKQKNIVSSSGGSGGGGGTRSASSVDRFSGNGGEMRINLNVTGKANGRELQYVLDNYNVSRGRTG